MNLGFIHGAPASGKLTVAKALLRAVPSRLFDNHAAIDLARIVVDFDAAARRPSGPVPSGALGERSPFHCGAAAAILEGTGASGEEERC